MQNWEQYKKKADHSKFIKDKGLTDLFGEYPVEVLRNRLLISAIQKETKKRKGGLDESVEPQTPKLESKMDLNPLNTREMLKERFNIKKINLKGKFYHMVLLSQRPVHIMDQESYKDDRVTLSKKRSPKWMRFDTVFFFSYNREGDQSQFRKSFHVLDIQAIIVERQGCCLKLQLKDKHYIFHFESNWEVVMWKDGLSRARNYQLQLLRTRKKVIAHDVRVVYEHYHHHRDQQIVKYLKQFLEKMGVAVKHRDFLKAMAKVNVDWGRFCDAFYAYRPFTLALFKFCAVQFFIYYRRRVHRFWQEKFMELNSMEIIHFAGNYFKFLDLMELWGLDFPREDFWSNSFLTVLRTKFYAKTQVYLTNILCEFKDNFRVDEKNHIVQDTSENLEAYLYTIFDHYQLVPTLETAKLLLEFCSVFLYHFFVNAQTLTETQRFEHNVYVAILNNNFAKSIKSFLKKVHRMTKGRIDLKTGKFFINQNFLISKIIKIEKTAKAHIARALQLKQDQLLAVPPSIVDWDFVHYCRQVHKKMQDELDMYASAIIKKPFKEQVFRNYLQFYFRVFSSLSFQVCEENLPAMADNLKKVQRELLVFFEENKLDQQLIGLALYFFNNLTQFLNINDVDMNTIQILNFMDFYDKPFTYNILKQIVKYKVFYTDDCRKYIYDYFREPLEIQKSQKNIPLPPKEKDIQIYNFYVFKFLRKMKLLLVKKRAYLKTIQQNTQEQEQKVDSQKLLPDETINLIYSVDTLYSVKGWVSLLKFQLKEPINDDTKLEKLIKKHLTDENDLRDRFVLF